LQVDGGIFTYFLVFPSRKRIREKPQLGTKKAKLTAIGYKSSILNGQKQFSSIYITYTLLMEAQGNLNEEQLDDEQAAEVLADLNGNDIENQAPINHIDDYMRDYMMDKNKAFDKKLLNKEYTSRSDAYKMLALESCSESMGCISCAKERYCAERIRPTHARMGGQLEAVVSRGKVHRSRRSFKRGADPTSSRCRNRGR